MAKKKYYAVTVGRIPGIYGTWDQCKEQTDGFSGAKYQSFSTLEEAEQFVLGANNDESVVTKIDVVAAAQDINAQVEARIANLADDEVVAFVDGSYDVNAEKSAFGAIILSHNGNRDILYKSFTKKLGEEFISLRNVAAELEGVKEAICWALTYKKRKIAIYYDYEGIEKWATGQWQAKNTITREYVQFSQEKRTMLDIEYIKVPAHSGVKFNEEVDTIAKNALLAKGHKTYNDGSVYFVGYGAEDWVAIIQCINEENLGLTEEVISPISINIENLGTRDKIKVAQSTNTVVINCYKNSKSYVQGKQTVLFQKIIATAIEMSESKHNIIETLNSYHALTIKAAEVEIRFEHLLPHYKKETDKHYANLLSAVYNAMLTGYMPDYTCLVTPIFRAYEYYLHRILGDTMHLITETDKGTNNFSFFSKNDAGLYECNSRNNNQLTVTQLDYLNLLYTKYNGVRHPYSHWSASDVDTAVITDINSARQILLDGLNLIDQYYTLFK